MNPEVRDYLSNNHVFAEFPGQLKSWITKSDHASELLADFLKSEES